MVFNVLSELFCQSLLDPLRKCCKRTRTVLLEVVLPKKAGKRGVVLVSQIKRRIIKEKRVTRAKPLKGGDAKPQDLKCWFYNMTIAWLPEVTRKACPFYEGRLLQYM